MSTFKATGLGTRHVKRSRLLHRGLWLGLAVALPLTGAAAESPVMNVTGMTFVGTRGSDSDLVLHSERARFYPDTSMAYLEGVRAVADDADKQRSFTMTCERAEFNVETNDFFAEGDVKGVTSDGQRYSAPWVRYDHERALLYTDAPVLMVEERGTFRGDGFRYQVRERTFQLLGNVTVVQEP